MILTYLILTYLILTYVFVGLLAVNLIGYRFSEAGVPPLLTLLLWPLLLLAYCTAATLIGLNKLLWTYILS